MIGMFSADLTPHVHNLVHQIQIFTFFLCFGFTRFSSCEMVMFTKNTLNCALSITTVCLDIVEPRSHGRQRALSAKKKLVK